MKKLSLFLFSLFISFGLTLVPAQLAEAQFIGFSRLQFNYRQNWSSTVG